MDRGHAPAPPLQVLWAGRWHDARAGLPFVIGRAPGSQLQIDDPHLSRHHVTVVPVGSGWELRDTSRNGTFVDGRRVTSMPVTGEMAVTLGAGPQAPRVVIRAAGARGRQNSRPPGPPPEGPAATRALSQGVLAGMHNAGGAASRLRIGRAPDNDVVIDDLLVSRYHAELRRGPRGWQLVDLGQRATGRSSTATVVSQAPIGPDDVIGIGHALLQLDGDRLVEYADVGQINFRADGLTVRAGEQGAAPRRRVRARGAQPARRRRAERRGQVDAAARAHRVPARRRGPRRATPAATSTSSTTSCAQRIGLVPQDDILHKELTVRRALGYAARLRFPSDVSRADRNRRIDEVLAELGLQRAAQPADLQPVRRAAQAHQRRAGAAHPPVAAVPRRADLRAGPGTRQVGDADAAPARRRRPHGRRGDPQRRQPRRLRPAPAARPRRARWPTSARPRRR